MARYIASKIMKKICKCLEYSYYLAPFYIVITAAKKASCWTSVYLLESYSTSNYYLSGHIPIEVLLFDAMWPLWWQTSFTSVSSGFISVDTGQ